MKKLMTIYKVVCAGLLAGVFTVACTEDDWGKQGGTQGGVALSSYKERWFRVPWNRAILILHKVQSIAFGLWIKVLLRRKKRMKPMA